MQESDVALQINEIYDAWGDCFTKLAELRRYFETAQNKKQPVVGNGL